MPFIALLDLLERQWAAQLRQVSLVSEADVPEEMSTAAAEALGHVYGHEEVAVRWPACMAISLTRMAAAREAFWPRWRVATKRRGNAAGWGKAFLAALEVFGLPREATATQSIMLHDIGGANGRQRPTVHPADAHAAMETGREREIRCHHLTLRSRGGASVVLGGPVLSRAGGGGRLVLVAGDERGPSVSFPHPVSGAGGQGVR
ncbi:hypothetical protein [Nonomuraea basaltis]|uniref:hypothetical protein n=1 Tax=Nonomuraea basaltis TaxID=2495887 RepID=UPI00110C7196|nr:hypothetical protein [Nonomuraea basaltis]TMR93972.1 hypothetical protein EJK15_36315 [Nonomuraea basaltis]